jgi:serine/threonine protein kinase
VDDTPDDRTREEGASSSGSPRGSESSPDLRHSGYAWPQPGVTLADRFRFNKLLGSGGNGEVWEALNIQLRVKVAIKLPNMDKLAPDDLERFRREARALCLIHNEHVLRFFEYNTEPTPYLVMELLRGRNLAEHLEKHGPLSLGSAKTICRQLCAGLQAVHDAGIIHRDLKPSNIYCLGEPGKVKIVDFGLMKLVNDAVDRSVDSDPKRNRLELTGPGIAVGTPQYMSPEQWSLMDHVISYQSDLWSLAVVLYKLLTGETPFKGPTPLALARSIMFEPTPDVSRVRPDLPPGVDEFFRLALNKEPGKRFGSAREMGDAFEVIQEPPRDERDARQSPDPGSKAILEGNNAAPISCTEDAARVLAPMNSRRRKMRMAVVVSLGALGAITLPRVKSDPVVCAPGTLDCDQDASNGCEVDGTGLLNCGECKKECLNGHGATACVNGSCAPVCESGFADCDGNAANGCEADLHSSAEHCGRCGHACEGGPPVCSEGACVVALGGAGCAALAIDADPNGDVYWTNPSARLVQTASKRGGPPRTLWTQGAAERIVAARERAFWIDINTTNLIRYRKGAGAPELAMEFNCDKAVCAPIGLAASGDHVYFTIRPRANPLEPPSLWRLDVTSPILQDKSLLIAPGGLAADAHGVYWVSANGPKSALWKLDLAGPMRPQKMLDLPAEPSSVAIDPDGRSLYWTERGSKGSRDGFVGRAPASQPRGARAAIASAQADPGDVAVDQGWVYWSATDGAVRKAPKDGSSAPVIIARDAGSPTSIAVDDRYVFWVSAKTGAIKRAAK